jgi:hypothetical protein
MIIGKMMRTHQVLNLRSLGWDQFILDVKFCHLYYLTVYLVGG